MSFTVGDGERWFNYVGIVIIMYYFLFVVHVFRKIHRPDNLLTRILFDYNKTPIYIAGIIAIAIVFIKKLHPNADYDYPYFIAAVGVVVSVIAILKRSATRPL